MAAPQVSAAEPLIQATLLGEAVDAAPVAIFVADDELRYVAVSRHAAEMLGYTRAELLELKVTDVARDDDGAVFAHAALRTNRGVEGSALLTRKDGTTTSFRYVSSETRIAGMPLYVSIGVAPRDL